MLSLLQRLDLVWNETTGNTVEEAKQKAAGRRYCVRRSPNQEVPGEWMIYDEHCKRFLTNAEIMAIPVDELRMVLH